MTLHRPCVVHQRWICLPEQKVHINGFLMQWCGWLCQWEWRGFLHELHCWFLFLWAVWCLPAQKQGLRQGDWLQRWTWWDRGVVWFSSNPPAGVTEMCCVRVSVQERPLHPSRLEVWPLKRLLWRQWRGKLRWVMCSSTSLDKMLKLSVAKL